MSIKYSILEKDINALFPSYQAIKIVFWKKGNETGSDNGNYIYSNLFMRDGKTKYHNSSNFQYCEKCGKFANDPQETCCAEDVPYDFWKDNIELVIEDNEDADVEVKINDKWFVIAKLRQFTGD